MASLQGNKWTPDVLRISLVGKTGCGKSSTGNTILGRKAFVAKAKSVSVTQVCSKVEGDVDGRQVALVDTPGLCDTTLPTHVVIKETYQSISLLAPGPHAILLLIQIGRFTKEERDTVEYIKAAFGEDADKYIMVLFTRGDDLEEEETPIEEYIMDSDESLQRLIADCGGRSHVFNNKKEDRAQVKELLRKIDNMLQKNGGTYYTSEMLQEAERAIQEKMKKILSDKEEEIRRQEEEIRRKYQQEMEKMMQEERQRREEEKRQMEKALREMERTQKEQQQRERVEREWRDRDRERNRQMEQEKQRQREEIERKQREEEYRREMERRLQKEVENIRQRYTSSAREEAEQNNSFLDNVGRVIDAAVTKTGEFFKSAGNVVAKSVSSVIDWFS